MKEIILISGKARSGKDLSADIIKNILENQNQKVLIIHYADYLKYICSQYFNWDGNKDDRGRSLLQYVGTDLIRSKDESFLTNIVINLIKVLSDEFDYILIPDTRFKNEIIEIQKAFNENILISTIRVERKNFDNELSIEQKQHRSETELDEFEMDFYISTSSIEELTNELEKVFHKKNTLI